MNEIKQAAPATDGCQNEREGGVQNWQSIIIVIIISDCLHLVDSTCADWSTWWTPFAIHFVLDLAHFMDVVGSCGSH